MRRGITLVEMAIAFGIVTLLVGLVYGFYAGASASTGKSVDHSDAIRSTLVVSEFVRHDLSQMLYNFPSRDLALQADGTGLSLRIPLALNGNDMWNNRFEPVTYKLQPEAGAPGSFEVERADVTGSKRVRNCRLAGLHVVKIPPGGLGRIDFLQVTMVGLGASRGKATYTASVVMPLIPRYPPVPYRRGPTGRVK